MGVSLPDDVLLRTRGDAAVVLEVLGLDPSGCTNGDPPRLRVHILEVLRGQVPLGPADARWDPESAFYAGRSGPDALARWQGQPLAPPPIGARYLVLVTLPAPPAAGPVPVPPGMPGADPTPRLSIHSELRRQATPDTLAWAHRALT